MSGLSDEELLARLRHEVAHPPFHAALGVEAVAATKDGVTLRLPYKREFSMMPGGDYYHGGVLATLVDIAGHAAIAVAIGRTAPTIDLRIDYLKPAPGVALTAVGRALRIGKSIARADIEIRGPNGDLYVVGRGAFSTQQA